MIDTVIFDMDGILVDSEPLHKAVDWELFRLHNLEMSEEAYAAEFVGLPLEQMLIRMKSLHGWPETVAYLMKIADSLLIDAFGRAELEPIAGVADLLQAFDDFGVQLALGSSSPSSLIELILEKTGLSSWFSCTVSGYQVPRSKPHPDIYLHICRQLETEPVRCLVIEDSRLGIQAGKLAGMTVVGVATDPFGRQDLSAADLVLRDFSASERSRILEYAGLNRPCKADSDHRHG